MTEDELFARRPLGMRMAMVVRQWRAIIDSAITDTGLTQSSWTVLMQLHQLGDNVSVSELAEVQGIELPPLTRTYVLGHELTHALWTVLFGGRASGLKVGDAGETFTKFIN